MRVEVLRKNVIESDRIEAAPDDMSVAVLQNALNFNQECAALEC